MHKNMSELSSEERSKVHHSSAPSCRKLGVVRQMTSEQDLSRTSSGEGGRGFVG